MVRIENCFRQKSSNIQVTKNCAASMKTNMHITAFMLTLTSHVLLGHCKYCPLTYCCQCLDLSARIEVMTTINTKSAIFPFPILCSLRWAIWTRCLFSETFEISPTVSAELWHWPILFPVYFLTATRTNQRSSCSVAHSPLLKTKEKSNVLRHRYSSQKPHRPLFPSTDRPHLYGYEELEK